ncbi:lysozyme [Enterobacter hormaechei]|uniref:glycoside hydrolase family protein n=1 Tax=Enterobacter hormaechei TaxID=158836 RepID=UPI0011DE58B1|nr:lysozyme [Enterobacter hormaechei]TXT99849.1 lysozyme [Enterobacter hormaechei]
MTGYALQTSSAAIALIKKQQGLSLEKYRDEKGLWVIGYGHVIRRGEQFNGLITPAEAEYLLFDDIHLCETLLLETIGHPLPQQQHDALVLTLFSFRNEFPLPEKILQAVARV